MLINFAKNWTLVVEQTASPTVVFTDSQPVDEENLVSATVHVKALPSHSSGTPFFIVTGQGSNDGVQWQDNASLTTGSLASGEVATVEATVGVAFVRFKCSLDEDSSTPGDWAAVTFDLNANFSKT